MTEKDNLEKGSGDREDQGRVGNLECGLSDSTEPEAYHHMISFWQNRGLDEKPDGLLHLLVNSHRLRNVHPGPLYSLGITTHVGITPWKFGWGCAANFWKP